MNPDLLQAVKERIALGHSKEAIAAALEAAGYNRETIEQVYNEAQNEHERTAIPLADGEAGHFAPSPAATELPSGLTLFKAGWRYMQTRLDLVVALGVLLAIITGFEFLFADPALIPNGAMTAVILGAVLTGIVYLFVVLAALYVVMQSDTERVTIGAGVAWAKSHILGFLWVSFLTVLVVLGGFLLFIIPGIIVSLYLYFAQYVFVKENLRGMAALKRSTQLVMGNWWTLFIRLLVLGVLSFLLMLPLVIVTEVVAAGTSNQVAQFIVAVVTQVFASAVTMISLYAIYTLYTHLATARPADSVSPTVAAWKYRVLIALGVVSATLIVALAIAGATMQDMIMEQSSGVMTAGLTEGAITAEMYFVDTGTYAGVCGELAASYESFGTVVCNDSAEAWAMSLESDLGSWCADSTGFIKQVPPTLGDKTQCLSL